jgi:hypothetical protein
MNLGIKLSLLWLVFQLEKWTAPNATQRNGSNLGDMFCPIQIALNKPPVIQDGESRTGSMQYILPTDGNRPINTGGTIRIPFN